MTLKDDQGGQDLEPYIPFWRIPKSDPGYIYIVEDHGRYKIGKSKHAGVRLKAARTWLPDMNLIGCKPFWNVSSIERDFHVGFCVGWYAGEWFQFDMEEDRDLLLDGFLTFSDTNRDMNSINFIYWFNGDGMAEFVLERSRQDLSLPKFLKQESWNKRG